jgi:hypothetical protein
MTMPPCDHLSTTIRAKCYVSETLAKTGKWRKIALSKIAILGVQFVSVSFRQRVGETGRTTTFDRRSNIIHWIGIEIDSSRLLPFDVSLSKVTTSPPLQRRTGAANEKERSHQDCCHSRQTEEFGHGEILAKGFGDTTLLTLASGITQTQDRQLEPATIVWSRTNRLVPIEGREPDIPKGSPGFVDKISTIRLHLDSVVGRYAADRIAWKPWHRLLKG